MSSMSFPSLTILPSCAQCSAVKAEGSWVKNDGNTAKTTQKLSACSRCHITRYCDATCQGKHWSTHKVGCITSEKVITPQEVDKIVKKVCESSSGKVILSLTSKKEFVSTENFPENSNNGKLCVEVKIQEKLIGTSTYLLCKNVPSFDWKTKLDGILHPSDGIHNPGAVVELGHQMIEKGLYQEAFDMMATQCPQHYKTVLQGMFFPKAVNMMHTQGLDTESIVKYAALLQKNRSEVEVLIAPPTQKELPKELQKKIDAAEKLPYGKRDFEMETYAKELVNLGLYDQAFDLVFNWVALDPIKISFFRAAALKMISANVSHDKLVQLAKKIYLSEAQILNEVVGLYATHNQIPFANQLAAKSNKPDYYFELIFSALLNEGKKEEAKDILKYVSSEKRQDLLIFLK